MNETQPSPSRPQQNKVARVVRRLLYIAPVVFSSALGDLPVEDTLVRETQIGQRMPIFLGEATQIVLGGDTSMTLTETLRLRKIVLSRGELSASVRHGDGKTLEVVVNRMVVYHVGTQFVVSTHDGTTNVSVTEGHVQIFEHAANGTLQDPLVVESGTRQREPTVLAEGDQARVEELNDGSIVVDRAPRDAQAAQRRTQWLHGTFDATGRPLDEAVWEFNRYNLEQIAIDDPHVARLKIGGIHQLDNVDGFLKSLEGVYHIEVTSTGGAGGPRIYHLSTPPKQGRSR